MEYVARSQELVGYPVKIMPREAFKVTGYTLIVPPDSAELLVPRFWDDVMADGRLARLKAASSVPPWSLGLGSWDEACAKGGSRYTICIEETPFTDFSLLAQEQSLFTAALGPSDWMCFEMTLPTFHERFWKDDPYKMIKLLGYRFNGRVGVHFDAFPPDYHPVSQPTIEFLDLGRPTARAVKLNPQARPALPAGTPGVPPVILPQPRLARPGLCYRGLPRGL